jgi:predicted metal-dependent phosphoesterase TrpH
MLELKIDLHVHTNHSDSISSLEAVVDSARMKELDGIAITDHDTMTALDKPLKRNQDLILLPGVEVETREGHILILGLKKPPPKGLSAIEVAEYTRKKGGVVIIAHPNIPFHSFNEDDIRRIRPDAIETYNAKTPFSPWMIRRNIALAKKMRCPQTGGSDSHMHQTVGDMYTLVNSTSRDVEEIMDAIRIGNVKPVGNPSPLWERPIWLANLIHNRIRRKNHVYRNE